MTIQSRLPDGDRDEVLPVEVTVVCDGCGTSRVFRAESNGDSDVVFEIFSEWEVSTRRPFDDLCGECLSKRERGEPLPLEIKANA